MQKDTKGNLTHVTINLKKHKEVLPMLQQMSLIEKSELKKMQIKIITFSLFS